MGVNADGEHFLRRFVRQTTDGHRPRKIYVKRFAKKIDFKNVRSTEIRESDGGATLALIRTFRSMAPDVGLGTVIYKAYARVELEDEVMGRNYEVVQRKKEVHGRGPDAFPLNSSPISCN